MSKYQKPASVNTIWAVNALDINLEKPSDSYIQTGWTQVKPPYEFENWSMRKLHQGLAYYNQLGIPEWDMNTEYQAFQSYVQGTDNRIYRCIQTHSNRNPASGNTQFWEAFEGNRQATTSRRGTIQLATQTETDNGSRNDVAITPSTLQNKRATQSAEGILRFATNQEVAAGARDDVALSPATLQFRAATTNQTGLVELATVQEAREGIRNDIALTPQSISGLFEALFPVGSIVMRPTDPGLSISNGGLGFGTWQKISGRSIIGDGSHTDSNGQNRFFVAGQSEGTYQHRLSTQELPSHNHSASSGSAGGHSHTVSGETNTTGNHNHSASSGSAGNHSHSLNINNSGVHSHSGSTSSDGSHSHTYVTSSDSGWAGNAREGGVSSRRNNNTSTAGAHTHSLSINNAGSHSHTGSTNTTGAHTHDISIGTSGNHSHSVTGSTNTTGAHTHSISVSSTGGNQFHNNIHPVFVAPIWYRTA
jgi:microcystin-dependent protein